MYSEVIINSEWANTLVLLYSQLVSHRDPTMPFPISISVSFEIADFCLPYSILDTQEIGSKYGYKP